MQYYCSHRVCFHNPFWCLFGNLQTAALGSSALFASRKAAQNFCLRQKPRYVCPVSTGYPSGPPAFQDTRPSSICEAFATRLAGACLHTLNRFAIMNYFRLLYSRLLAVRNSRENPPKEIMKAHPG